MTEAEKLTIDKKVRENRVAVIEFVKKIYGKGKVSVSTITLATTVGILVLVSMPKEVEAVG